MDYHTQDTSFTVAPDLGDTTRERMGTNELPLTSVREQTQGATRKRRNSAQTSTNTEFLLLW